MALRPPKRHSRSTTLGLLMTFTAIQIKYGLVCEQGTCKYSGSMGLDWIIDYNGAHDPKYGRHKVPMVVANAETFKDYGHIVQDFDAEVVEITPWPVTGKRKLCEGTGTNAGAFEGDFICTWNKDVCKVINDVIDWGPGYLSGRLPKEVDPKKRTSVLAREANYHPDGGQVFFPKEKSPFVALLALPGDDIRLEDFVAFYCDGSFGIQIHANIWHQPVYPLDNEAVFRNKQGAVCACVSVDTINEFGKFLEVPLIPPDSNQITLSK